MGRGGGVGGGRGLKDVPSTVTSVQIPNHKTTKQKKTSANSTVNKLRKGKLREVTKCLLTQFSEIQVDIILNLISLDSYFKNFC